MKTINTSMPVPTVAPGTVNKPKIVITVISLLSLLSVAGCGHEENSANSTATNSMATNSSGESQPAMPAAPNTNMPSGTNASPATNPASPP